MPPGRITPKTPHTHLRLVESPDGSLNGTRLVGVEMRIAVVHSFYRSAQPSGENRVVEDQVEALCEAGHDVLLIRRDTDALTGPLFGARTALSVALDRGFDPTSQIRAFNPHVVHAHNLFPNFSTNWVRTADSPVVVTLHNFRLVCSNGMFFREGQICVECVTFGSRKAIEHGCYRQSRVATFPVALSRDHVRHNIVAGASALVTTSELSDEMVHQYLVPGVRTHMIPNFGPSDDVPDAASRVGNVWIAAGRLSPEKGFAELIRDWPTHEKLIIIGDGPLRSHLESEAQFKNIDLKESMSREDLRFHLGSALGLLFPSRWFEADPQIVVEAMRLGTPVVSFQANAVARIVETSGAGRTYDSASSLCAALIEVREKRSQMSKAAQEEFERRWTKSLWLSRIQDLYQGLASR